MKMINKMLRTFINLRISGRFTVVLTFQYIFYYWSLIRVLFILKKTYNVFTRILRQLCVVPNFIGHFLLKGLRLKPVSVERSGVNPWYLLIAVVLGYGVFMVTTTKVVYCAGHVEYTTALQFCKIAKVFGWSTLVNNFHWVPHKFGHLIGVSAIIKNPDFYSILTHFTEASRMLNENGIPGIAGKGTQLCRLSDAITAIVGHYCTLNAGPQKLFAPLLQGSGEVFTQFFHAGAHPTLNPMKYNDGILHVRQNLENLVFLVNEKGCKNPTTMGLATSPLWRGVSGLTALANSRVAVESLGLASVKEYSQFIQTYPLVTQSFEELCANIKYVQEVTNNWENFKTMLVLVGPTDINNATFQANLAATQNNYFVYLQIEDAHWLKNLKNSEIATKLATDLAQTPPNNALRVDYKKLGWSK